MEPNNSCAHRSAASSTLNVKWEVIEDTKEDFEQLMFERRWGACLGAAAASLEKSGVILTKDLAKVLASNSGVEN